jgi:hypothetical protein
MPKATMRVGPGRLAAVVAMTVTAAAVTWLAAAGSALARPAWGPAPVVTLNGDWAPFNRCPVDNPAMLSANGVTAAAVCGASVAPSGSITIGNLTYPTGESDLQFGAVENYETESDTMIVPESGVLIAAPAQIPGGLPALICPSAATKIWLCGSRHDRRLIAGNAGDGRFNAVTATLQEAGAPSDLHLTAGIGQPSISEPVKIHLQNPLLGEDCYIGSDSSPIVLQPEILAISVLASIEKFDANGTPNPNGMMTMIKLPGLTTGDISFAVPAASGCGARGRFDEAINRNVGLPSPSGKNSFVANNVTDYLAGVGQGGEAGQEPTLPDGEQLSKNWHSAVLAPAKGEEREWPGHWHGHW